MLVSWGKMFKNGYDLKGLCAYGVTQEKLKMLEEFTNLIKFNYSILDSSYLKFFKSWLVNE